MSDDEVGYKKPPKHSQFQKGQSGNPKGRPKGTKNLKTDLLEEMGEQVLVREGERSIKVSKQRAMIKRLAEKALRGDTRAISVIVNLLLRLIEPELTDKPLDEITAEDRTILEAFQARLAVAVTKEDDDDH